MKPFSPVPLTRPRTENLEQTQAERPSSDHGVPSRLPSLSDVQPTQYWSDQTSREEESKTLQFWDRNKSIVYMLFSELFGTLMNTTAKWLEIHGNNGQGLHPFHILFARMSLTTLLVSSDTWYAGSEGNSASNSTAFTRIRC